MYGIGFKKEFWSEFKSRFGIKRIAEFYGATESNIYLRMKNISQLDRSIHQIFISKIVNITNREGSCGFLPYYYGIFLRLLYPAVVIKVDPITLEPVRNRKGLCKLIGPGDTGVIIGRHEKNNPIRDFKGYTSAEETKRNLIHDIVSPGDSGFLSRDLLEMDKFGNLYFKDRTGDTFRWKGI